MANNQGTEGPFRRVLLAHNFYGSSAPSGENIVYGLERDLLRQRGHEVLELTRHSDEIRGQGAVGALRGAVANLWNPASARALRKVCDGGPPAVIHAHNTFPLISPSIFAAARALGVPTVLTLHNYRLFCANALLLRDGQPCTECLDRRSVRPALARGCYRESRAATAPLAAAIALHKALGTWRGVDAFVTLTPFQREVAVRAGLPEDRVHVRGQFHPDPPRPVPWGERQDRAVFIGRLSAEKGVHLLVEAWRAWGEAAPPLEIIGDGPARAELEAAVAAAGLGGRVTFTGFLKPPEVAERLGRARLLLVPSVWFEGFPLVVREAFAAGVPVAASRIGSLASIVADGSTGALFNPGDAQDLLRVARDAFADPARLASWGSAARREFEARYTADVAYRSLMEIYAAAGRQRAQA